MVAGKPYFLWKKVRVALARSLKGCDVEKRHKMALKKCQNPKIDTKSEGNFAQMVFFYSLSLSIHVN